MKVTICTFDDSINHLPIAHLGGHREMFDYLKEAYSFSNLALTINPTLDYIAFVDSDDMPDDIPLARLNTVSLKGAVPTKYVDVLEVGEQIVLGNLSWDGNYYVDGDE